MWEKEEIETLEQEILDIERKIGSDTNNAPTDEIIDGLTFGELKEVFTKIGRYIDSELFIMG